VRSSSPASCEADACDRSPEAHARGREAPHGRGPAQQQSLRVGAASRCPGHFRCSSLAVLASRSRRPRARRRPPARARRVPPAARAEAKGLHLERFRCLPDGARRLPRARSRCVDAAGGIGGSAGATRRRRELVACQLELVSAKASAPLPARLKARVRCVNQAQLAGFQCRRRTLRRFRRDLRQCQAAIQACAGACDRRPPGGASTCKSRRRPRSRACSPGAGAPTRSRRARASQGPHLCADCVDARETCNALTQTTLDAALASCHRAGAGGVSACVAANPGGGSTLQDLHHHRAANAFTCRDAALEPRVRASRRARALPVLRHGCPSAQSGSRRQPPCDRGIRTKPHLGVPGASHDVEGVALGIAIGLLGCRTPGCREPADETADGAPVVWTRRRPSNETPSKWEFRGRALRWISGNYGRRR